MKTTAILALAMMMAPAASASGHTYFPDSARYARANPAKTAGSYNAALRSANAGVVESALAHVAMIKLTMPGCDIRPVAEAVSAVERRGASKELRYKAWIVRTLLDKPELFAGIAKTGYPEPDALFGALEVRMAEFTSAN